MGSLVAELAEKLSAATNSLDFDEQTMFLNTSANTVGIGTNAPGAKLEIEQGSTGGAIAFLIDNDDTDKVVMSIEAANIDADVMDISMDAVTTAKGIDITADGLTTGSAIYVDDNSASTSTRNTIDIIQNNAAALAATALKLQSDGGITGMTLDKNFTDVAAATVTGLHVDFDRTVPGSGTATFTDIGINLDVNAAGLGTTTTTGLDIDVVGATSGTHTAVGIDVAVGSADVNYAAKFTGGSILIQEQADAVADIAAYGQLWVNTATPNELYFTTDAGDDIALTSGTSVAGGFDPDAAVVFNDSQGNNDFRIESDADDYIFFVNAGADKINIGTSSSMDSVVSVYNNDTNNGGIGIKMQQSNTGWALIMEQVNTASSADQVGMIWRNAGNNKWFQKTGSVGGATFHILDADQDDGVYMAQGGNSWVTGTSDERRKTDWITFTGAIDKINSLTKIGTFKKIDPVTGEYKNENQIHVGVSAQEIQDIIPSAVGTMRRSEDIYPDDVTEYLTLDYQAVFVMGLKAIQELSAKVTALENA